MSKRSEIVKLQRDLVAFKRLSSAHWKFDRYAQKRLDEIRILEKDAINFRLEGMNEFRRQIESTQDRFLPKAEYIRSHEALEAVVAGIRDGMESRFRALERLVWMAGGAVTVITIILNFLKKG
jgi:hypothetical protein